MLRSSYNHGMMVFPAHAGVIRNDEKRQIVVQTSSPRMRG